MADTKISAETAASALTGAEIVPVVQGGNNRRTTTQDIANLGGGGGGLLSQVLSAKPTIANTGLSTWVNQQSATITDGETGLVLVGALAATHITGRIKTPPATPYNIDILVDWETVTNSPGGAYGPMFGWYDGTKIQAFAKYITANGVPQLNVLSYATVTSGNSAAVVDATATGNSRMQWLRIGDDGTTVRFSLLPGGNYGSPALLFSVAKASGYLGASGYSNIFFGMNRNAGGVYAALLSYTER